MTMTVMAGVWQRSDIGGMQPADRVVAAMLDAQYPAHGLPTRILGDEVMAIGQRAVSLTGANTTAEPVRTDCGDDLSLAVDARIDNRDELFDELGLARDPAVGDAALVVMAFRLWGEGIVDHLLGDFAIAAWEPARQTLTLLRDPVGQRPLHYRVSREAVAFASMPQGFRPIDPAPRLNATRLAQFVADGPSWGPGTFFEDILRVEPAQIVRIDPDGIRKRTYWTMPTEELRLRDDRDYVAAFREQLDRATRVRLRDAGDLVAAHLSAGLDSSAVASTAARLIGPGGGRVLAITSAPRAGFDGPVPAGRIADESGVAAAVAARYPAMEHLVLRPSEGSLLDHVVGDAGLFAQPVGHPCNNVWWRRSRAAARGRGATVLLTGEMGNLTISAGGLGMLADLIRGGRPLLWLREVAAFGRGDGPRWRGLMAASFAPWVPRGIWSWLTRFSAGGDSDPADHLLLTAALQRGRVGDPNPRQAERELRWDTLRAMDPGPFRKASQLSWGIDERDPTSDRRLIEFCFSLPPSQLIRDGRTRRLARAALADRLPETVIAGVRGYQYADWYEALDRDRLKTFARRVSASPAAAAVIDFDAVDRLIATWPPGEWASMRTIGTYRIGLLRALAAGAFALNAGV